MFAFYQTNEVLWNISSGNWYKLTDIFCGCSKFTTILLPHNVIICICWIKGSHHHLSTLGNSGAKKRLSLKRKIF